MNVLSGSDVVSFTQSAQLRVRMQTTDSGQRTNVNGAEGNARGPMGEHHAHRGHHGHRAHQGHHSHRAHHGERGERDEQGAAHVPVPADQKFSTMELARAGSVEMSAHSSGKTSLYIKTQEGDTVRLKIQSSDSVKLSMTQQDDGEKILKTLQLEGRSSLQIKFSVNGDLNADELAAITSVIDQAGALAEDFFSGGLQSAFASAAALNIDGQQLAKVGLKMQVREQFTYSQQGLLSGIGAPAVEGNSNSTPTASDTTASATPATTTVTQPTTTIPPPAASTGGEVVTPMPSMVPSSAVAAELAVEASAAEPVAATEDTLETDQVLAPKTSSLSALMSGTLGSISDFLTELIGALDDLHATPDDSAQSQDSTSSLSLSLKLKIFESVLISASATTPINEAQDLSAETPDSTDTNPQMLPALVSDTLDALAANQQPSVEVVA